MHPEHRKCLSDFEISAYIDGRLSPEERQSFEQALMECEDCRGNFGAIRSVILKKDDRNLEDVPEHIIRNAVNLFHDKNSLFDIILGLIKDSVRVIHCDENFDVLTPLPVGGLRAGRTESPKMIALKKSFEDIKIELDIEKTAGSLCNIGIHVAAIKDKSILNNLRIELISGGRELISTLLEDGKTTLEDITTGKYTIRLHKNMNVLGEISLKIQ
ncbi:MAG: zf-HC2 domain-containing protein [Nitrospirae bacterium]|nr:zf-HC2 domain-containing protein [Nitrospirota bacterium]